MKKLISLTLLACLLLTAVCLVSCAEQVKLPLSSLDEAQCLKKLRKLGCEFPEDLINTPDFYNDLYYSLRQYEQDPDAIVVRNSGLPHIYDEQVRAAVRKYYGLGKFTHFESINDIEE